MGFPIALGAVTSQATGDYVLPICLATAIPGRDMVHVQLLRGKLPGTILASELVSLKKVLAIEFHLLNRQTFVIS